MKKKIVFATSNSHKVQEVREMMEPYDYEILSLKDVGLEVTHPEDGDTFEANALIKAEDIAAKIDYPVLSDDSGLVIDALNGFPGVYSARFMEGHPYTEKNQAVLDKMKNMKNRKARFYAALVYLDKKNHIQKTCLGISEGEITKELDQNPISGFGYDPIFYSYELKKTFGQCTAEEKDSVSHRGKALREMITFLRGGLNEKNL